MNFGRSLSRNLQHSDLPLIFTKGATITQGRAKWHHLVATKPPFAIGKQFLLTTAAQGRYQSDTRRPAIGDSTPSRALGYLRHPQHSTTL